MTTSPWIGYPTRPSLSFAGNRFTGFQVMALIVLADVRHGIQDGPACCTEWRCYLASNLTLTEYERKGWRTAKCAEHWRDTLKQLRGLGMLPPSGLVITDAGAAVAAGLKPLINGPLSKSEMVKLNSRIHERKTGRFAA